MSLYFKAYLGTLAAFVALDAVWLGLITPDYYDRQIGHLMAESPNWLAAAGFYLLYLAGIVYLAVSPSLREGSVSKAALRGAVLGAVAYGTYAMTALAVLRDWPLGMTFVDIGWGGLITGCAAAAGSLAARTGE